MSFHLYTSNRMERLAAETAELLRKSGKSFFEFDTVVVQSKGMERWLCLEIAERNGISSRIRFPFPKSFIYDCIFSLIKEQADAASGVEDESEIPFSPQIMTWQLMKALPDFEGESGFERITQYTSGENGDLKRYQVAERIAGLFDQYLTFRPDIINAFEGGESLPQDSAFKWQAELWNRIVTGRSDEHFVSLYRRFVDDVYGQTGKYNYDRLRDLKQVYFFGFSSFPPAFLDIIYALSTLIDVHFFYFSPCACDWYYQLAEKDVTKQRTRFVEKAGYVSKSEEQIYYGFGNPLLGSLGKVGREFFGLIRSIDEIEPVELFEQTSRSSLLSCIQDDILEMTTPDETSNLIRADDLSIQIHSCHSSMREVQVLYDNLLALFDRNSGAYIPGLQPKDILVLTPDVQKYAPYIQSVFETVNTGSPKRIHASISDRNILSENLESNAYIGIFDLIRSRFTVTDVLDVFQTEAVYTHFGLTEEDIDLLKKWLNDVSINWGLDREFREKESDASFDQNSWEFGFDKMLLGYALSPVDGGFEVYRFADERSGIIPYENIEGGISIVAGNFMEYLSRLKKYHDCLIAGAEHGEEPHLTPSFWREMLQGVMEDFFNLNDDRFANGVQEIRNSVNLLLKHWELAGSDQQFPPEVVTGYLKDAMEKSISESGFLQGGVTFCRFQPMRSIPAKVICMIGMNDGEYPRKVRKIAFDLMEKQAHLLDRNIRNEDRFIFLETLLSARERLLISYVGRSIKDNSVNPPSVLVSEICDYIRNHYRLEDGGRVVERLIVQHPLQPFSRYYFDGSRAELVSYSSSYCNAARIIQGQANAVFEALNVRENEGEAAGGASRAETPQSPFFAGCELIGNTEDVLEITLEDLIRFFSNPSKYIMEEYLRIKLDVKETEMPADHEPFELGNLERYQINKELVESGVGGSSRSLDEMTDYFRAKGVLPVGNWGLVMVEDFYREAAPFAMKVKEHISNRIDTSENLVILLDNPSARLKVRFSNLFGASDGSEDAGRQVFYRYSTEKSKDLLRAWFYHLALLTEEGREKYGNITETLSFFKKDGYMFGRGLADGTAINGTMELAEMVKLYVSGMKKPLKFFPETSRVFAERIQEPSSNRVKNAKKYNELKNSDPDEAERFWIENALEHASAKWFDADWNYSDGVGDRYTVYCFGEDFPGDEEFINHALTVYDKAIKAKVKLK